MLWGGVPIDDGNFRYSMFTIHPDARTTPMNPGAKRDDTVIFGDFAQFIGFDVVTLQWVRGEKIILTLYWRPTDQAPPPRDYSLYIHLLTPDGQQIAQWDGVPLQDAYPTRFWRPGESLLDYWVLRMPQRRDHRSGAPADRPLRPADQRAPPGDGQRGDRGRRPDD